MAPATSTIGFPRIGPHRELKATLERCVCVCVWSRPRGCVGACGVCDWWCEQRVLVGASCGRGRKAPAPAPPHCCIHARTHSCRYWKGAASSDELRATQASVERTAWGFQRDAGVEHIGADGTLYDHVLDAVYFLGATPQRFQVIDEGTRGRCGPRLLHTLGRRDLASPCTHARTPDDPPLSRRGEARRRARFTGMVRLLLAGSAESRALARQHA